ncbi:hypothetical protein QFC24_002391 [Naganishia onofrii]|uniref:Uncharacterized protein n=1 Tax=Naganishia onofrii TaxID=1851511 RepID=A0ACC2XQH8_9TREE|nr:hypothetical protein QFC24_002391 [Naganishia onofrii]
MIGDVNLFLPHGVEEDVECEIMVADWKLTGVILDYDRLNYVTNPIHLRLPPNTSTPTTTTSDDITPLRLIPPHTYPFLVRIGTSNHASINLFQQLGFAKVKTVQAFEEVEMRFGWVPMMSSMLGDKAGGSDTEEGEGGGEFMDAQRMGELAQQKWTKRGHVVWYE